MHQPHIESDTELSDISTLHYMLENGSGLHVNECQKIQHYRARSTEEERRRMPNHYFSLLAVRMYIALLWRCYTLIRLEISCRA